jgi:uncharacterized membrane protein YgaE (UPF0421/DUF939 family)
MTKLILEVELVPETCFFSNVRSVLSKTQWTNLSKQVRSIVHDICEICGSSTRQPLHAHEVWHYDSVNYIQKLIGMVALCRSCHRVKHFGFAQMQGREEQALKHLMKINKITKKEAEGHITNSFQQWTERSKHHWKLDISYLSEYGVDVNKLQKDRK